MSTFDHVLFDLGGVLVDFRGVSSLAERLGRPLDEVADDWLASPVVRAFERGDMTTAEFIQRIQAELQLDLEEQDLRLEMAGWLPGLLEGAAELIADLRATQMPISCLSNTNDFHWRRMQSWGVDSWFDHRLLSHEIGMVKPDAEIFEHACLRLDTTASRILYFDDHPANTAAARASGLRAVQVVGPQAARAALEREGVLSP